MYVLNPWLFLKLRIVSSPVENNRCCQCMLSHHSIQNMRGRNMHQHLIYLQFHRNHKHYIHCLQKHAKHYFVILQNQSHLQSPNNIGYIDYIDLHMLQSRTFHNFHLANIYLYSLWGYYIVYHIYIYMPYLCHMLDQRVDL